MRPITDERDLRRLVADGWGYIYNDFSGGATAGVRFNILHQAYCGSLVMADLRFAKYFAADLDGAVAWLDANRRGNWKRCPVCLVPIGSPVACCCQAPRTTPPGAPYRPRLHDTRGVVQVQVVTRGAASAVAVCTTCSAPAAVLR